MDGRESVGAPELVSPAPTHDAKNAPSPTPAPNSKSYVVPASSSLVAREVGGGRLVWRVAAWDGGALTLIARS